MSKIFTRTFRVRWGELDPSGTVSPANYLRYLIETAWDWGDAVGLGMNDNQSLGLFWVIRETEIRFLRSLRHNDIFDFTIWLVNWQRVRGSRCFELKRKKNGEVIAQGTQQIVSMDAKTGKPASPPEDLINQLRSETPRLFPFERFPKITPAKNPFVVRRQVESMDLDVYDHANNAIYIDYAEEAAARDFAARGWTPAKFAQAGLVVVIRRVHIQYSLMTTWGETLTISTHQLEIKDTGGTRYVRMTRPDGIPVTECTMDWDLVDHKTGEAQPLPVELC
jgi:YbgC/YbaW family acyl-CoA thioester hydrolase